MKFKKSSLEKINTYTIIYSILIISFTIEIISQYDKIPTKHDIIFFILNLLAYLSLIYYHWRITKFRRGLLMMSVVVILNIINLSIKIRNYMEVTK